MMNGWNDGGWGAGEWAMLVLGAVFLAAVVVGIVYLLRGLGGGGTAAGTPAASGSPDSPEDILKRRYAAGEIDKDEYESRLRDLRA